MVRSGAWAGRRGQVEDEEVKVKRKRIVMVVRCERMRGWRLLRRGKKMIGYIQLKKKVRKQIEKEIEVKEYKRKVNTKEKKRQRGSDNRIEKKGEEIKTEEEGKESV